MSMASSFSSSSFCRPITAMIMFLSSSVRWLRSGSSCMGGGTVGGRGPRGPTVEDIFVACPPPPLALSLSPFGDSRPAAAPLLSPHSGALPAAAAGGGAGAAAVAAAEPGRARTQSFMVVCIHPAPDAAFVLVALARLRAARPPPAAQPRPAGAGRRRRGGRREGARAPPGYADRGVSGWARGAGAGLGLGLGRPPPRLLSGSTASSLGLREGEGVWVSARRSLGGFAPG